jgi:hypothetical protein
LEDEWVPLLAGRLEITRDRLPVLWDADFMLGEVADRAEEGYILCEINVSSVAPYPESANAAIVATVRSLLT